MSEPWLMLPFAYILKTEGMLTPYSHKTASHAIEDFVKELPNGKEDFYEEIRKFTTSLYEKVIPDNSITYFLDKTPRYYLIVPFLVEVFPDAKFILLFRNPLEVMASILTTWMGDRFDLYQHYVDLYYGPQALSHSYHFLKDRAIAVNYTELVEAPEVQMQKICSFLEVPFDQSMIENYKIVKFSGRCGDFLGINQFGSISSDPLGKWKTVLNTRYRKRFSKRYIKYLGKETLMNFGFSMTELIQEIDSITQLRGGSFQDAFYHFTSHMRRLGNVTVYKRIISSILKKERYYPFF